MSKPTAFVPQAIAPLESRVVPSHAHVPAAHVMHHVQGALTPAPAALALEGTVQGVQTPVRGQPGTLFLKGAGHVAPLGAVSETGTLTIRSGEPTFYKGTVTLTGALGSVSVQIARIHPGPIGFGRPIMLHYTITGGTGAYRGDSGSGAVAYNTGPSPIVNPLGGQSTFRLTFGAAAVV
jgi:hypothetical protein